MKLYSIICFLHQIILLAIHSICTELGREFTTHDTVTHSQRWTSRLRSFLMTYSVHNRTKFHSIFHEKLSRLQRIDKQTKTSANKSILAHIPHCSPLFFDTIKPTRIDTGKSNQNRWQPYQAISFHVPYCRVDCYFAKDALRLKSPCTGVRRRFSEGF